ncbi:MAG: AMP-binding protein [Candidatus Arcticimaribacter sp.]
MEHRPNYKNIHNRFLLNGNHYRFEDLFEIAHSFIKEGEAHEKAIGDFLMDWIRPNEIISLKTSGSTGKPKTIHYNKQAMVNSALATGDHFDVKIGDKALHCLNADYIAGKMMLVRAMILGLEIDLVPPQGNILVNTDKTYDFAAMAPLQVEHAFEDLNKVKTLLIGGAPSSIQLKEKLKQKSTHCYETYGMTETVTHIASRKINGETDYFSPLPGVNLSIDERGCMVIDVPYLSQEKIVTNDLVSLESDHRFLLKGRVDNVINTGGIKVIPEEIEAKMAAHISQPFFVGALKDQALGQKVILLLEGETPADLHEQLLTIESLTKYELPKAIHAVPSFERTPNGKIMRQQTISSLNL